MVSGGTATTGFHQDEGKDVTYRPTAAASFNDASVGTTGPNAFTLTGVGTTFAAADIGATIVVSGEKLLITNVVGQVLTVSPSPSVAIAALSRNWYLVRRATKITDGSQEGKNVMHVLWRPTVLGIFNYAGVLGSGDYRIQLNPEVR